MANPTWPAELPWFQRDGYGEEDADNVLRSPMASGPPKSRRISTSAPRFVEGVIQVDEAEYAILQDFFINDCNDGATPFDRDDVHGEPRSWQFQGPIKYRPIGIEWAATIALMQMP